MDIKIHSIHFDADQKLTNFIQGRVNKLETFDSSIIHSEVFLRLDKAKNNENRNN